MKTVGVPNTDARRKAAKKYIASLDEIKVRLPKGDKDKIKAHAEQYDGGSVNAFIQRAISEQMRRDQESEA